MTAFSSDPHASMESRLGWQRAIGAASRFETWLLCENHEQLRIDRYLHEHGAIKNLHICYVDREPIEDWMYRTPGLFYMAYHRWQRRALESARKLHAEIGFDLIHHANFCGFREPGYLWQLDAPFVWGPVGGTQNLPTRFLTQLSLRGALHEVARSAMNCLHFRYRWRVVQAIKKSAKILTANSTGYRDFLSVHGIETIQQLETGIIHAQPVEPERRHPEERLRILWAGRYCEWKALPLLLKALRKCQHAMDFRLRVLAYGPKEKSWKRMARRMGIADRIDWVGWPSYVDSFEHFRWADVFAFTSLRDTSGTGILEALAHGCPIVGLDHQGAHDILAPDCGIAVPVKNPQQVIKDMANGLIRLAEDEDLRLSMSQAALERSKRYSWDALSEEMCEVYDQILEANDRKANPGGLPSSTSAAGQQR